MPTPVTDGTYLYVVNDRGIMFCLDAKTGKEIYGRQRLKPGTYSGSPVLADGKIYVTNEDGVTSVIKAGPAFELLGGKRFRRLHAQLAGGVRRTDLLPHREVPLRHRALTADRLRHQDCGSVQFCVESHGRADVSGSIIIWMRRGRSSGSKGSHETRSRHLVSRRG